MIVPRRFDIIKHERFSDVAVLIEKICKLDHKWKVKGTWINQGFVNTWSLGIKAKFDIPKEKIAEWLLCQNPNAQCVRNEKWLSLSKN